MCVESVVYVLRGYVVCVLRGCVMCVERVWYVCWEDLTTWGIMRATFPPNPKHTVAQAGRPCF